jgi:hypothetical protein
LGIRDVEIVIQCWWGCKMDSNWDDNLTVLPNANTEYVYVPENPKYESIY